MYITAKNIKRKGIDLSNVTYVDEDVHREIYSRCDPQKGDILYIKDGATCGISTINDLDDEFSLLSSVALIKPNMNILNSYLNIYLQSEFCYRNVRRSMKGVGITRIILKQMELWEIPIPPYEEQKRIVREAEYLLCLAEEIEKEQTELRDFVFSSKVKILDLAIHGKLVPQDPAEEPAIELLKRINPAFKASDNLHYEGSIPSGWQIVRMGDVIDIVSGTSYQKTDIVSAGTGIRVLRGGNIQDGNILICEDDVFIDSSLANKGNTIGRGDTVIVASTGSSDLIGKAAFATKDYPETQIGAFLRIIRPKSICISEYLGLIFQTEYYKHHIKQVAKGTNINNIKSSYITEFVIPLPPLEEQRRIQCQLKRLLSLVDQITDSINGSE